MIISPLITLFYVLQMKASPITIVTSAMGTHKAWSRWIEYTDLKFRMQDMYLTCMKTGGPFIVTNDPLYMPYVIADAAYRGMAKSPPGGSLAA